MLSTYVGNFWDCDWVGFSLSDKEIDWHLV